MRNKNLLDNGKNENHKENTMISLGTLKYGAIIMTTLFAILIIIEFAIKDSTSYNLLALYIGYFLTTTFYRFKVTKDKIYLFTLIIYLLFIIFNIFLYITRG